MHAAQFGSRIIIREAGVALDLVALSYPSQCGHPALLGCVCLRPALTWPVFMQIHIIAGSALLP